MTKNSFTETMKELGSDLQPILMYMLFVLGAIGVSTFIYMYLGIGAALSFIGTVAAIIFGATCSK